MVLNLTLNGKSIEITVPGDRRVVDLLREDFGLTGTKEGCGTGECGACTILVDGTSRLACLMVAAQLEGRSVQTIEGVASPEGLDPLQQAFMDHGAVQCGFCTPGMVMAAIDLFAATPAPSPDQVREAISGNLCRCTGYHKIVKAIAAAGDKTDA